MSINATYVKAAFENHMSIPFIENLKAHTAWLPDPPPTLYQLTLLLHRICSHWIEVPHGRRGVYIERSRASLP